MSWYHICPYCGAHLDPGERCDCKNEDRKSPPFGDRVGKRKTDTESMRYCYSITDRQKSQDYK